MRSHPFRRRNALAVHDLHYGPNMTPMVDVVMVILIFFMASAVFIGPEWFLRSAIPVAKQGGPTDEQPERLNISLRRGGGETWVKVNDDEVGGLAAGDQAVQAFVKTRQADRIVALVSPEPDVPWDDVVRMHETCQRCGIRKVGMMDAAKRAP